MRNGSRSGAMGNLTSTIVMALAAILFAGGLAAPASAQIMKQDGFTIPWFHSESERRARQACEQELPECRPSVLAQINAEKQASLITPWLGLGVAVLGVLFYMRKKEREKIKHRQKAQRRHDPKAFRKLDQTKEDRDAAASRDRDDAF